MSTSNYNPLNQNRDYAQIAADMYNVYGKLSGGASQSSAKSLEWDMTGLQKWGVFFLGLIVLAVMLSVAPKAGGYFLLVILLVLGANALKNYSTNSQNAAMKDLTKGF